MRITKKKLLFSILQPVFYGIVPLCLIFLMYGNLGNSYEAIGFKIAAPGIVLLVLAFMCFKKLFINKKLADAHAQLNNLKADLKVKTDVNEVANIEKAVKNIGTLEAIINSVVPILLFILLIACCKVMGAQLVKMSGTCGFILLSYIVGTVFAVLEAREVHSKHNGDIT